MPTASQFYLLVGAVLVPAGAWGTNIVLRASRSVVQSSAADLLLLMLVFDAAALLDVEHFSAFARSTFVRETIVGIHVGFIFLGLFTWVSTVNFLERRLLLSFDVKLGSYRSGFPFWTFFSCWLIASLLVALHVLTYTFDFEALAK